MGKNDRILQPFTMAEVNNKNLVIEMLKFEDYYGKSEDGQNYFRSSISLLPTGSLEPVYAIHRYVLTHFGYSSDDQSVANYRNIFKTYYTSPTNYDNDVISSVYYMKGNKCVFYNKPKPKIGEKLIDCNLLNLDGTNTTLFNVISNNTFKYCFIGAFSSS